MPSLTKTESKELKKAGKSAYPAGKELGPALASMVDEVTRRQDNLQSPPVTKKPTVKADPNFKRKPTAKETQSDTKRQNMRKYDEDQYRKYKSGQ